MEVGTTWSKHLQPTRILDNSRSLRYSGHNQRKLFGVLPIESHERVLDTGCGPGSLSRSMYSYFGGAIDITGVDSDENFVEFAESQATKWNMPIRYKVGDALDLDIPDDSFDVAISSSVIGHVDHEKFLAEQVRILKPGGRLICMRIADYKVVPMENLAVLPATEPENALRKGTFEALEEYHKKSFHGKWRLRPLNWRELAHQIESRGLQECQIQFIKLVLVPDNYKDQTLFVGALKALYENEYTAIEVVKEHGSKRAASDAEEYGKLLDERVEQRIEMFKKNERVWDYSQTDMLVAWGIKKT